jgi:CRP-like cAMP-binding protein
MKCQDSRWNRTRERHPKPLPKIEIFKDSFYNFNEPAGPKVRQTFGLKLPVRARGKSTASRRSSRHQATARPWDLQIPEAGAMPPFFAGESMRRFISPLLGCRLFDGIKIAGIEKLLDCFHARARKFEKDAYIFMENDELSAMGIIISGAVHLVRNDFWGNRTIIARITPGEIFAESFACVKTGRPPLSAVAVEKTEALFIQAKKISAPCASACPFHTRILNNMIQELAGKNVTLINKIQHITQRSTREKLISYLSAEAKTSGNSSFDIPFNREELAEFLSVDRSAMSSELGRMKTDGLLTFRKNHFTLFKK